ncbi:EF-hand calcium-binding domain-containing protein 6 isoform X2 [Talpa occidentalis]|nr:EF-hand calcium-binding domain-containing protein 6 isoform X2 [Talpa occidentalis]
MKLNSTKANHCGGRVSSTKTRDLMCKTALTPDWRALDPHTQKSACLRPHSSPCQVHSRSGSNMSRPCSSNTAVPNPILSFLDVKRILFQKITDKGDELKKAFQLLDTDQSMTVSKSELRRIITTFLLPLTREQFQDVLAQIPLTRSGTIPYVEFLSRFGGIDLNMNVIKRGSGTEKNCCRTLKELESQVGEKISKNIKSVLKAFKLVDVNRTHVIQAHELRRVLETFCLKMKDDEYKKFAKHYNIDKDATVDYNTFLKTLNTNNELNLKYHTGNQEISQENQQVKNSKIGECLPNHVLSEEVWKDYSVDEMERTFRQQLSRYYDKVEKALGAGDPTRRGYVSLNYLKVVLDTFVCRLPRRVFIQLMKRLGFRTTSKIDWKQFLMSFHAPEGQDANNKIPLAKGNSINSRNLFGKENIVARLFGQGDRCSSLRKLLLIINAKPAGQLTGQELRHILSCSVVKTSDADFKELMQQLDPEDTKRVDIGALMHLLEGDPKTRKTPACPDTEEPLLAWDSVEEIVRDSVSRRLQYFHNMLRSYDLDDTGLIGRNNFKRIMRAFCPFLTPGHLVKLCSKSQDPTSGRILYKQFLADIGIPSPAAISPELRPLEEQPQPDLSAGAAPAEESTSTKTMTKDQVMERLKACVQQQDPALRKRFLDFSKEPDGKISALDFRKVLADNGMAMDNDQYALLIKKIGFGPEGMSYNDFTTGFQVSEAKMSGPEAAPRTPEAKMSGPEAAPRTPERFFITAEECQRLFPQKLKDSFRNPYSAFFKVDTDRNGIINMLDFRRLLQLMLLNLRDREFERFLSLLGLRLSVTLNFREFRGLCEKRPPSRAEDAPQRLVRSKKKVTDLELACEQAHQFLVTKAKHRWTDLSKNFIETDHEGRGILRRRDVRNALYGFDIPLTPREFEKLWTSYDTEGRGFITYQEFLEKLGISYSEDVHRPNGEGYFNFMGHFTKPQQIQEEMKELQQNTETAALARDKLKDHYQDISQALSKLDASKSGHTSLSGLQKALQASGCALEEEELTHLLSSWGISWHNDCINYLDFLQAVENSKPAKPQPDTKEEQALVDFSTLNPEEVLKHVQEVVAASELALAATFLALDKEDTGFVKASDFGQVLKDFCYKLTDNQYHYFLRRLRLHLNPHINWKYFLQNLNDFHEESAATWVEKMPKGPPPRSPKDAATQEMLTRLHKAVAAHYHAIAQELESFDTMKTNTTSRDEFRAICTRHVQVLTDEQFDRLWSEMPVNAKGRLRYQDFLSRFGSEKVVSPLATGDPAQAQRGTSAPEALEEDGSAASTPAGTQRAGPQPQGPSAPGSVPGALPLQNCESLENKLRKRIQGCWRGFLRECKEKDTNKQGAISTAEFLALVEKFNLDISTEEAQQLAVKYDLRSNGQFAYCDFIQSCVLLLKAKETSLLQRLKIQNAHKMKETGAETSSFYSALLRIQPRILHCWRPMRRSFKSYDQDGTGLLSVADFRRVLRQYGINLSEEEFFHVLEYYDKALSSRISYNDFLRAFLQ